MLSNFYVCAQIYYFSKMECLWNVHNNATQVFGGYYRLYTKLYPEIYIHLFGKDEGRFLFTNRWRKVIVKKPHISFNFKTCTYLYMGEVASLYLAPVIALTVLFCATSNLLICFWQALSQNRISIGYMVAQSYLYNLWVTHISVLKYMWFFDLFIPIQHVQAIIG